MSNNKLFNHDVVEWVELDNITVPALFSSIEKEVEALRNGVALSEISHTAIVCINGADSDTFVDRITPCILNIKPSQMKQTIFINAGGTLFAEGYICRDDKTWMILSHGIPSESFVQWLNDRKLPNEQVEIFSMNKTHRMITVNGPFAWELMAEVEEPEIISLPYLSLYHPDENRIIFRAGETGEFGYHQVVPSDQAESIWNKILVAGKEFDLLCAGHSAIEYCMLENNFFNIYREGKASQSPVELQLQWRFSYRKNCDFTEQLRTIKAKTPERRLTAICCDKEPVKNAAIAYENKIIGSIIHQYPNVNGSDWIGLALIDLPYAVSGVAAYITESVQGNTMVRTVSMPLVNNRSLYVDPQIHSYADRAEITFPPISSIEASYV